MDFCKVGKKALFKRFFVLSTLFFGLWSDFSGCYLTSSPTDPCILLSNSVKAIGLNFCSNATSSKDLYGRSIPLPCKEFGDYGMDCDLITDEGTLMPLIIFYVKEYYNGVLSFVSYYGSPCNSRIGRTCDQPGYRPAFEDPVLPPEPEGFLGSTIIQTEFGPRALDLVEVGDSVVSFDLNQGAWVNTRVIRKTSFNFAQLAKITIGSSNDSQESITMALDQKFYLPEEQKWIYAKDLQPQMLLLKRINESPGSFKLVAVESVELISGDQKSVVCLTLDQHQNLCVSSGILVHNCMLEQKNGQYKPNFCPQSPRIKKTMSNGDFYGAIETCDKADFKAGLVITFHNGVLREEMAISMSVPISQVNGDFLPVTYDCPLMVSIKETRFKGPENTIQENSRELKLAQIRELVQTRERMRQEHEAWFQGLQERGKRHIERALALSAAQRPWEIYDKNIFENMRARDEQIRVSKRAQRQQETVTKYNELVKDAKAKSIEADRKAKLWQEFHQQLEALIKQSENDQDQESCFDCSIEDQIGKLQDILVEFKVTEKQVEEVKAELLKHANLALSDIDYDYGLCDKFFPQILCVTLATGISLALGFPSLSLGQITVKNCASLILKVFLSAAAINQDFIIKPAAQMLPISQKSTISFLSKIGNFDPSFLKHIENGSSSAINPLAYANCAKSLGFPTLMGIKNAFGFLINYVMPTIFVINALTAILQNATIKAAIVNACQTAKDSCAAISQAIKDGYEELIETIFGKMAGAACLQFANNAAKSFVQEPVVDKAKVDNSSSEQEFCAKTSADQSQINDLKPVEQPSPEVKPITSTENKLLLSAFVPALGNQSTNNQTVSEQITAERDLVSDKQKPERIMPRPEKRKNVDQKKFPTLSEMKAKYFSKEDSVVEQYLTEFLCLTRKSEAEIRAQGNVEYADALKKCIEEFLCDIKETPIVLEALVLFGDFGKILNQNVEPTEFFYLFKGSFSRIYRLINDIEQYNLKKGNYIYPDLSKGHLGDHLEVFHGEGEVDENGKSIARMAKTVLDLEGNEIEDKTMIALGYEAKQNHQDNNKYWWRFKGKDWRKINKAIKQELGREDK